MIRKAIEVIFEELSKIAGNKKGYNELIANRAIPLFLPMMKRLGYTDTKVTAFHLTNSVHLPTLKKIENSKAQLSTFTIGGPELARLPSQPNCMATLVGTEVIRGKSDIWTVVDKDGIRWLNHNSPERTTKFMLTFSIDGIITKLFSDAGVDYSSEHQSKEDVLKKIESLSSKEQKVFQKGYFASIERWIDVGGYKELGKYLDNAAEMKYNEVILTKYKISAVHSIDVDNVSVKNFCTKNGIEYKGVFPSRGLSELKI